MVVVPPQLSGLWWSILKQSVDSQEAIYNVVTGRNVPLKIALSFTRDVLMVCIVFAAWARHQCHWTRHQAGPERRVPEAARRTEPRIQENHTWGMLSVHVKRTTPEVYYLFTDHCLRQYVIVHAYLCDIVLCMLQNCNTCFHILPLPDSHRHATMYRNL